MRLLIIALALLLIITPAIAKMQSYESGMHKPVMHPTNLGINENMNEERMQHSNIQITQAIERGSFYGKVNWQKWMGERLKRLHEIKENREKIREKIRERMRNLEEKIRENRLREKNREREMTERLEKYKEFRAKFLRMGLKGEGFVYAKLFVVHGAYACTDFMNLIKIDIENANIPNATKEKVLENLDSYISQLNEKIQDVNNSNTPEELRNATKELRSLWEEIKPKIRMYAQLVLISKLEDIANKAEIVGMRIEENITASGLNATRMEEMLDDYMNHVEKAKKYLNESLEKIEIENEEFAMKEINDAREELHDAFKILRNIYIEAMKIKPRVPFMGNKTGEFWVDMSGHADLNGSCIVAIRGNATISITPKSKVVTAVGFENEREADNTITYIGNGKIVAIGNVTVSVDGNFRMFVKGSADIYLNGTGEYRIKPLPSEKMELFELSNETMLTIGEWT